MAETPTKVAEPTKVVEPVSEEESEYYAGMLHDVTYYEGTKQIRTKGNKKEGEWIAYHKNGKLSEQGSYKDGKRDGKWIENYKDGTINKESTYKDGDLHGKRLLYGRDGEIKKEENWKDGEKDGKIIEYRGLDTPEFAGQKMTEKNYKDGKKHGKWTWYEGEKEEGELLVYKEVYYIHGKKVTEDEWNEFKKKEKNK
jgi:antitoxin component YwqK of YwqJK toxin-antitoxin module